MVESHHQKKYKHITNPVKRITYYLEIIRREVKLSYLVVITLKRKIGAIKKRHKFNCNARLNKWKSY